MNELNKVSMVVADGGFKMFPGRLVLTLKAPSAARNFSSPGKFTDFLLLLRSAGGLFLRPKDAFQKSTFYRHTVSFTLPPFQLPKSIVFYGKIPKFV